MAMMALGGKERVSAIGVEDSECWTAQEIAMLQAKLNKQLGPEYVSTRAGAGGSRVQYLEAWKCINIANDVFGFNGWSSSIQTVQVDETSGRFSLGLSVIVRVTLKDGTYHEDIGYGSIENCKSKGAAFEKAKKEGTTDALKRALRTFGNVLGNCLYDKGFCKEIARVKPSNFDAQDLYHRPEYSVSAPPDMSNEEKLDSKIQMERKESVQSADSTFEQFGDDDFDNMDFFEDKPILPESPRLGEFDTHSRRTPEPQRVPSRLSDGPALDTSSTKHHIHSNTTRYSSITTTLTSNQKTNGLQPSLSPDSITEQDPSLVQVSNLPPGTFFSARAAMADRAQPPSAFNPAYDSPSIRRTSGVDPKKSAPILRKTGIGMPPPPPGGGPATPGLSRYRGSPIINNGKRNSAGLPVDNRGPLGEISTQTINQPVVNGTKKART